MADINNNNHVAIVINSLDKIYKKAKITGILHATDLYLLDAINKLLDGCENSIINKERLQLISLYNKTLNSSKYICKDGIKRTDAIPKKHFTSSGSKGSPIIKEIQYWQENSYTNTIVDIKPLITSRIKQSDSYSSFAIGKSITYSSVGRICFLLTNETSINYKILDDDNNDISFAFIIEQSLELNSIIIVSNNLYSYGDILIKIIKNTI